MRGALSVHRSIDHLGWLARTLARPHLAPLSALSVLLGVGYSFSPIDIIPSRLPYVGHLDEICLAIAGMLLAFLLAPPASRSRAAWAAAQADWVRRTAFGIRVLRADLGNFFLFQYRAQDGFLITGKNSGTHWLRYMLSCAIAHRHGVAPPALSSGPQSNSIIGHPSVPRAPGLPRIAASHTIPSIAFAWGWPLLRLPPTVVLVRDIRDALLSSHVKWNGAGSAKRDFLLGDPAGRRHVADAWWYIHFFNRWGAVAAAQCDRVLVVHYEDLMDCPAASLARIAGHLGLDLDEAALRAGLAMGSRKAVADRLDPAYDEAIVPDRAVRDLAGYSADEQVLLARLLGGSLRHTLGYDLPVAAPPRRFARALTGLLTAG